MKLRTIKPWRTFRQPDVEGADSPAVLKLINT